MFSLLSQINNRSNCNLIIVLKQEYMKVSTTSNALNKTRTISRNVCHENNSLETLIAKYEPKMLYNSVIEQKRISLGYNRNNEIMAKKMRYHEKLKNELASMQPIPLTLKYLSDEHQLKTSLESIPRNEPETEKQIQFPYAFNINESKVNDQIADRDIEKGINDQVLSINDEILQKRKLYKDTQNWMSAYDNFENDLESCDEDMDGVNYGTPDPYSDISNVPCGGCGALLHCKDTGIPGYIPSEIFKNHRKKGGATLEAMICQRCYFLNEYNLALQVSVSPQDYPNILATIKGKQALVVVMVDLIDFPCSIWPGIADILGSKIPIIVVGNKVDLLPNDGKHFLKRVKQSLLDHIKLSGFATSNILHVSLISAKTGYGVEDLITTLQSLWKHKGDVYLIGCTNVGKSSLFNSLLQSDYCKTRASDLIQRATISQWPGTTLNMLKFPIMRPSDHRLYLRHQRMLREQHISSEENRLRKEYLKWDNTAKYASLMGRIGRSYLETNSTIDEAKDSFLMSSQANASGKVMMGIDENSPEYALSRWCFDTPGVVQPDQIIHLLTVDELMDTLPKHIIRPQTFCVKPGTTLFIAGLARLDYLEGPGSVRLTVFRSNALPITICSLEEADLIYQECLGTALFKVPEQGTDRLSKWPDLESTAPFTVTGANPSTSCNDVVLSSAGWIAINCIRNKECKFQAWTPEKRGIYVRDSLLPAAVTLRGPRIRHSVAYKTHRFI